MKQKMLLKLLSSGARDCLAEPEGSRLADRAIGIYYDCCREHADDPPAVKEHTEGMIYAGVALYRALQEQGKTPEEALALTNAVFEKFAQGTADKIRRLLRIPGLYRIVPMLFRRVTPKKYSAQAGFKMKFYDMGKHRAKFDVTACPYYSTCKAMGCPELTTIFCNTDDCCYGNMHPRLRWNRTKTIGRGAACCDFDIEIRD